MSKAKRTSDKAAPAPSAPEAAPAPQPKAVRYIRFAEAGPVYDHNGQPCGVASRGLCHKNPSPETLRRVAHYEITALEYRNALTRFED